MYKNEVTNSPYAEWLEDLIEAIMENKPVRIGVCAITEDGAVMTGYYGEICPEDKAAMAFHMQTDAIMDTVNAAQEESADEE